MHEGRGGAHYKKNGVREVCEEMEGEAIRVFLRNVLLYGIRKAIKKALWAGCAKKHELRSGTKDGNTVEMETAKAENYRHRQETGRWIGGDE